ncbi:MAG: hypothetical protein M0024_10585 [Nitrospiraceae bacterium]|nr:hypothetical protein [Nitrospiraceae bacterium]
MANCSKCNQDVTGRKFCSACGTPVPLPKPPQPVAAPKPQVKPVAKPVEEYYEPSKPNVPSAMVNKFKTFTLILLGTAMLITAYLIDKGWSKLADILD